MRRTSASSRTHCQRLCTCRCGGWRSFWCCVKRATRVDAKSVRERFVRSVRFTVANSGLRVDQTLRSCWAWTSKLHLTPLGHAAPRKKDDTVVHSLMHLDANDDFGLRGVIFCSKYVRSRVLDGLVEGQRVRSCFHVVLRRCDHCRRVYLAC